jgi:integrase
MARTAMDYDTRTKTARARLAPRPKAYFRQIAIGKTLGYIRREGVAGAWVVCEVSGGHRKTRILGEADDVARADGVDILSFEQVLKKVTQPLAAVSVGRLTVRDALARYFVAFAARSKHAKIMEQWANLRIIPKLGNHRVDRLSKTQIEAWLAGLVRDDPDDPDAKRRSQGTANRILSILKAALNEAFADDHNGLPSDTAWRRVKPYRNVGGVRQEHFESAQVRTLVAKAATFDRRFADLIEVAYLTGARLGELASANVCDFDADNGTLHVTGKTGPRSVTLTNESVSVLRRIVAKRLGAVPLLPRADGERWRNTQFRPMQRALALAELPLTASFYTLRHSYISRAIEGGMPLSLIAENCGTSLLMIQKNYAKVLARTRRDVIQETSPKLRRVKVKAAATLPRRTAAAATGAGTLIKTQLRRRPALAKVE